MTLKLDSFSHFLPTAIKIAKKSSHRCKHCALIVKNNKIISKGFNRCLGHKNGQNSYHAEHEAIFHCEKGDLRNADLIVIRINTSLAPEDIDINKTPIDKLFVNSKPCKKCTSLIEKCMHKYGLRNVYYST
tara:strand:+ start:51 stop:443 length:393 start_codon:yes stop_codon:yes gene_type:complete